MSGYDRSSDELVKYIILILQNTEKQLPNESTNFATFTTVNIQIPAAWMLSDLASINCILFHASAQSSSNKCIQLKRTFNRLETLATSTGSHIA